MDSMSSDFEWRFGDDLPEDRDQERQDTERAWRRWLPWLLVLVLLVGGAYAWWRDRQRTLAQAETQVEQVARLELQALTERDAELFLSLQDPTDRSWKEAQGAYLDTHGLPLPLQDLASPITTAVESARIVGERARVAIIHRATLPSGEEAVFRAVRFYRYTSDGRWLHTKGESNFAGHRVTFVIGDVQIAAFDEDTGWLEPLTRDLADVPYRFCNLVVCEQYSVLGLAFTTDLDEARALAKTLDVDTTFHLSLAANLEEAADPDDAVLPAPFLVGAPMNDAAQATWEVSLGQFLVDYLITQEIGPRHEDDHGGALVDERLRAWMKAELGVSKPISPNLELAREALDNEDWLPLWWRLWEIEPDAPPRPLAAAQIDLLLAFIEEEHGASAVAELLHFVREADSMDQLLNQVSWPGRSSVELQFPAYVRERTAPSTDDLSAFASYDLLMGCLEDSRSFRAVELWGWRLGSAEPVLLSARPPGEALVPMSWSPDGTRLVIQGERGSNSQFFLLEAGSAKLERRAISNEAQPLHGRLRYFAWSPDGNGLAYHVPTSFVQPSGSVEMEIRIIDFETEEEVTLSGTLIAWSPDGSRLLYSQRSDSETESEAWLADLAIRDFYLAQRDGTAPQWIAEGYAAAWSPDGEEVATISAGQALMAYEVATGRTTTRLDRDALRETLGFTRTISTASDWPFVLAWSPDDEWIAVGANQPGNEGSPEGAILLARPGEYHLLRQELGRIAGLSWAPNGQWLGLVAYHGDQVWTSIIEPDGSLLLREENAMPIWSPNGQHLALRAMSSFHHILDGLQILDLDSGERQEIDVPGTCWTLWNPNLPGGPLP